MIDTSKFVVLLQSHDGMHMVSESGWYWTVVVSDYDALSVIVNRPDIFLSDGLTSLKIAPQATLMS